MCIRPSRIDLHAAIDSDDTGRFFTGTVRRFMNEGDEYRVVLAVGDGGPSLSATVRSDVFESLGLEPGDTVHGTVPPSAVHVLGA
ncbi:TOBE domain-containing protein [Haloferax namakaokahaiae]|uniref:TOBE domain-containing protein n=1 Tax=Haloferax namakaokahaiae TaxID=1748331 RepID=UPI003A943A30